MKISFCNNNIKLFRIMIIILCSFLFWLCVPCPIGLEPQAWHMLLIFFGAIFALIFEAGNNTVILLIFLAIAALTKTSNIAKGFSGFASIVPWFLFFVLSFSKAITNSTIGIRISNFIVGLFGRNITSLSYSIPLIELCIAPLIPSNTARMASIGSPLILSLTDAIAENINNIDKQKIGGYFAMLYRYSNAICSGLFLTGMISNIIIIQEAQKIGFHLTWIYWFKYMAIPCLLMLIILPWILKLLSSLKIKNIPNLRAIAHENTKKLGKFSSKEKFIIYIFLSMLILWIFADNFNISIVTTSILGLIAFLAFGILNIEDVLCNIQAWNSVLSIGLLMSFVEQLISLGVIEWFNTYTASSIQFYNTNISLITLSLIYFFARYFFTNEGSGVIALFAPFLATGIACGIKIAPLFMTLTVFSSVGVVVSHYSSPVSIAITNLNFISTKQWLISGLIISIVFITIWFSYIFII